MESGIASIGLSNGATELVVRYSDGNSASITATDLRAQAMDAVSRRQRLDDGRVFVAAGLSITAIRSVGLSGVNIVFSDGHDRAIYPYRYLNELASYSGNSHKRNTSTCRSVTKD